ncbi:DUF3592 domain-containing protein [uncultured Cohaesibacter sp.]|uniref:DUF3592 domain-containing protein n=1 Tax=uncultured Cohaesibacter sp. TaxID=1002546 RepID=UPI00292F4192|nr:DUF3592 domain-containing protein [uncultured Cohaesibacter sp.]
MPQADSDRKRPSRMMAYMMLFISLGGFVYAALGWIGYSEAQIPAQWRETSGTIVERGIEVISHPDKKGEGAETYQPRVKYHYEVSGQTYEGTQLSLHHLERTLRGVAETEIEDIKQGDVVTVHYDPQKPDNAVLRKADTIGPVQAISVGLVIGLTCLALFFISLRRREPDQAETTT